MSESAKRYILLGLGSALLAFYLARLDYDILVQRLDGFPLEYAIWIMALNALVGLVKVGRWRLLLSSRSFDGQFLDQYLAVNSSFFMGLVTPGTIGEVSRALRVAGNTSRAFGIVLFEKVMDLGVLLMLVAVAGISQFTEGAQSWGALLGCITIVTVVYAAFCKWHDPFRRPVKLLAQKLLSRHHVEAVRSAYRELYDLMRDPWTVIGTAAVSLLLWLLPLGQMALIYEGLGLDLYLKVVALLYFLPYLVGVLSMVPLGLGTFELSLGAVAMSAGVNGRPVIGIIAIAPVLYRVLVTLPLVIFGYGCQALLTLRSGRTS